MNWRATDAAASRGTGLPWLADVLGWTLDADPGRRDDMDAGGRRRMWVFPGPDRPRLLVPAGRRVAGSALRTFNDSMSQFARIRRAALGASLRLRLNGLMRLDDIVVGSAPGGPEPSLLEHLETVLGRPVEVGVALGPELRPNIKPVLQVLSPQGELVAFAKIGWNELTKRLIENEAASLSRFHEVRPSTFDVPELLHVGLWADRGIVLVSPGPRPLIRRCARNAPAPVASEQEVARSAWHSVELLGEGSYLEGLRERLSLAAADDVVTVDLRRALNVVVERWGELHLPFGAWHGDWAPWNMSRSNGRLFVWDWERYGGPVPQGFDHVHLRFQLAYQVAGRSVNDAAVEADRSLRASGLSTAVSDGTLGPVVQLYLIERVLRIQEGRAAGLDVRSDLAPAALELLARARA
jgi:hypothetical protein